MRSEDMSTSWLVTVGNTMLCYQPWPTGMSILRSVRITTHDQPWPTKTNQDQPCIIWVHCGLWVKTTSVMWPGLVLNHTLHYTLTLQNHLAPSSPHQVSFHWGGPRLNAFFGITPCSQWGGLEWWFLCLRPEVSRCCIQHKVSLNYHLDRRELLRFGPELAVSVLGW